MESDQTWPREGVVGVGVVGGLIMGIWFGEWNGVVVCVGLVEKFWGSLGMGSGVMRR
jgi:hypothetical protein